HRWFATDRNGLAHAEPVLRRTQCPRPARMGCRAGHGIGGDRLRQIDPVVGTTMTKVGLAGLPCVHALRGWFKTSAWAGAPGFGVPPSGGLAPGHLKAGLQTEFYNMV